MRRPARALLALLILGLAGFAGATEDAAALLDRGHRAYEQARYEDAEEAYATLLAEGYENASVYYNLGCALARKGSHGEAVLALRRALSLDPRHEDAAANLAWLRARLADAPTLEPTPLARLAWAAALLPVEGGLFSALLLEWLAAAALLAFVLLARRGRRVPALAQLGAGLFVLALLFALSPAIQLFAQAQDDTGVVLAARVDARSGPAENNPVLFTIHEGYELRIRGERSGWVRIRSGEGLAGWVPESSLARVRP